LLRRFHDGMVRANTLGPAPSNGAHGLVQAGNHRNRGLCWFDHNAVKGPSYLGLTPPPSMVKVLPLDVWPYAHIAELKPSTTALTESRHTLVYL
jgi:hypothetical protein